MRAGSLTRVTLRLYDTATRELRDFEPLEPGRVGLYICGLTTQGSPHIGHVRFAVAFDILRRWLVRGHGLDVTLVRNVTDIDDKILTKSAEHGEPWWAWSYAHERATSWALDTLGVLPPTYEPRATGHITEMVELIDVLVERGFAINRTNVEGQMQGSLSMGLGEALFEEIKFDGSGRVTNPTLGEYRIPTSLDMPNVETIIVESDEPNGPFGAKEVGEGAIMPTIPAILNAVYDATGVRIWELPVTSERIFKALKSRERK